MNDKSSELIKSLEFILIISGDIKIVPEPVQSSPTHSLSDLDTMPRIMSCQKPAATELVVAKQEKIHGMTIKVRWAPCTCMA